MRQGRSVERSSGQEVEMLSARQEQAQSIAAELHRLGAWVVTPLPLDSCANLRFQLLDKDRDKVLEKLASWEYLPSLCSSFPRITANGMEAATIYELALEPERQPIPDDRRAIYGEIASREKTSLELEALRKYLGITK
jgi:hypothetical protein